MQTDAYGHEPVLAAEVIEALAIKPDGTYIDCTYGRGGHSAAILGKLENRGRLLALDRDPAAVAAAQSRFQGEGRFEIVAGPFSKLAHIARDAGVMGKVQGIVFDLGVSSAQLDEPARGFSFLHEGPLDMRMDPAQGISAAQWLKTVDVNSLARVFRDYGEERYARRIAKSLVAARHNQVFSTTRQLAEAIAAAHPAWERDKHPATRCFQAIRIFINDELGELKAALSQAVDVLAAGGRLAVISFHSLEDRIVKQFMRAEARGEQAPVDMPWLPDVRLPRLRIQGRARTPSHAELAQNPRARSARLRVAERLA
jgi:16S rRNA (cytosine1402-N4)-methyltransferase